MLVVGGTWGKDLVDAFVREGTKMIEEDGCVAFVTSCVFVSSTPSFALICTEIADIS